MTRDEIRTVLATISGYWPTPTMSTEEVIAWTSELSGRYRMTYAEVREVIDTEKSRDWRPRAGELIGLVQAHRRAEARRNAQPAAYLEAAPPVPLETILRQVERCRSIVSGATA